MCVRYPYICWFTEPLSKYVCFSWLRACVWTWMRACVCVCMRVKVWRMSRRVNVGCVAARPRLAPTQPARQFTCGRGRGRSCARLCASDTSRGLGRDRAFVHSVPLVLPFYLLSWDICLFHWKCLWLIRWFERYFSFSLYSVTVKAEIMRWTLHSLDTKFISVWSIEGKKVEDDRPLYANDSVIITPPLALMFWIVRIIT